MGGSAPGLVRHYSLCMFAAVLFLHESASAGDASAALEPRNGMWNICTIGAQIVIFGTIACSSLDVWFALLTCMARKSWSTANTLHNTLPNPTGTGTREIIRLAQLLEPANPHRFNIGTAALAQ